MKADSPTSNPDTPTHDCEIQGKDTPYIRTLNIETNEQDWACIWCMMAKKMKGQL